MKTGFWQDRRVLVTGHTGFKGAWLSLLLESFGAQVTGISLAPETSPNLFSVLAPFNGQKSCLQDICDAQGVRDIVARSRPQILIHMAAQALVRRSYATPLETFDANVMGTANILDALRDCEDLEAALLITTDKVYENLEERRAFVESDKLGGDDPYSASKAAAELVIKSYAKSFFEKRGVPVASARAGNVIGGGDWSQDRLIPDLWRAHIAGEPVVLRYPDAVRPWQHVLEPVFGYLKYIEALLSDPDTPRALNFSTSDSDVRTVRQVVEAFSAGMNTQAWVQGPIDTALKESQHLTIDPGLARRSIGWYGRLTPEQAIALTVDWYRAYRDGQDMRTVSLQQLRDYQKLVA